MNEEAKVKQQELIDIIFDLCLTIHGNEWFKGKTRGEVAEFIRHNLKECGYDVEPCGSSWGILK